MAVIIISNGINYAVYIDQTTRFTYKIEIFFEPKIFSSEIFSEI